jgi:hypothetical protein
LSSYYGPGENVSWAFSLIWGECDPLAPEPRTNCLRWRNNLVPLRLGTMTYGCRCTQSRERREQLAPVHRRLPPTVQAGWPPSCTGSSWTGVVTLQFLHFHTVCMFRKHS